MTNKNKKLILNTSNSKKDTSLKIVFKNNIKEVFSDFIALCKWLIIATVIGCTVSYFTSFFAHSIKLATSLRNDHPWLLYCLPIGGIFIISLYSVFGLKKDPGTNRVFSAINNNDNVLLRMAPLIFIATFITHLCGGSAGRAGALLQIGGSIGYFLATILKFDNNDKKVFTMCGMSAAFAAVFGTPLAATILAIEVCCIGTMYYSALVPCIFASLISSTLSSYLGIEPERFKIINTFNFNIENTLKVILIALICAATSSLFCYSLRKSRSLYSKITNNNYIIIIAASIIIIIINKLLQTTDYMGTGIHVIKDAMNGNASPFAFILKLLLTTIAISAGFKGGEIFPSFFIGATLGCALGNLLGISPSLCAALGLIGVFCGVTNCPITSILISFELFGYKSVPFFLIVISITYMMSGYNSLYEQQNVLYKKTKAEPL